MNLKTMGLSNETIQKLVRERRSQNEIQKGIDHQNRLRFHSVPVLRKADFTAEGNNAYQNFISWVGIEKPELLPKDKFTRFKQLLHPPIPTNELTESIYSQLFKVFSSQDAFFNYQFITPEIGADWEEFRDKSFWATHGFQAMQSAIDAVWVVDLPEMQLTERPEPFNRLVDIADVIDIRNDENNNCIYVILQVGDFVIAYDHEFIRVYQSKGSVANSIGGGVEISREPIKEIPHGLGYTPARQFWSDKLSPKNFVNKASPITKQLADLDWLVFHMTSKKYMDISNSYPITVAYEIDDDNEDPTRTDNKDRTEGGKKPKGNSYIGPGTFNTVPPPIDKADADLMNNPIKLISPDVETLEWHVSEEVRLTDKIYRNVVGVDQNIINDVAKNEKQIDSAFETRISVLFRVKANFEVINKFADSTIAQLRYGASFIRCQIDYGTKFFLKDVNELHQDFDMAKKAGADEIVLSQIQDNILNTKYKEDHDSRERAEIIRHLNPLPDKTITEAITILENGGIDKINFVIKANLINFVQRFERENISLDQFARDIDFSAKVDSILKRFKEYANEFNQSEQRPGDTD